jgi:hypothetical protein
MGEAAIETAKSSENEGSIQDNLAQVTKSISHSLQATTILRDG